MPLLITLRRDVDSSPFRRQLERICTVPGGCSLILCSGYIWEPDSGYSVLGDDLLTYINSGVKQNNIITIAGKLQSGGYVNWLQHYRNFVSRLLNAGLQVTAYIAPKRNWHAKNCYTP